MKLLLMLSLLVHTLTGPVEGVHTSGCDEWLGIPYAQPLTNDTAIFRHPQPYSWTETLVCDHGRANCIQQKNRFSATNLSHDCLYLNIFRPDTTPDAQLPVVIWLHGGAYAHNGTGADDDGHLRSDMAFFARETGAIVVTLNYRLNLYGYLYLQDYNPALFQNNCGLMDQLMAMSWVHDNIGYFGGDNERITLLGQSAGAASVAAIMSLRSADPLYSRAILMSPCLHSYYTPEQARKQTKRYMRALCTSQRHWERLLSLTPKQVARANSQLTILTALSGSFDCAFSPVIDGVTLPEHPAEAALQCTKPIIITTVADEGKLFWRAEPLCSRLTRDIFLDPIAIFYDRYPGPKQRLFWNFQTPYMLEHNMGSFHAGELPTLFGWTDKYWCDPTESSTLAQGKVWRAVFSAFINEQ